MKQYMKRGLILALLAAISANTAVAHSKKKETTPEDGAVLSEAPSTIGMTFDDPIRITMVRLLNAAGDEMPIERETGLEPTLNFSAEPSTLEPGAYTVEWRGLAKDGHAMKGSFSFRLAN